MKHALMILLLCVVGAGLAACAVHGDDAAATSHGFACGSALVMEALASALAFAPLTGRVVLPGRLRRPPRRPVFFFQPPEQSA